MKNETKATIMVWMAALMIVAGFLVFSFSVFTGEYDQAGQGGIALIVGGAGVALIGVVFGVQYEQFLRAIAILMEKADDLTVLIVEHEAEARRILELAGISPSVIDDVIAYLKDRYGVGDEDESDEPG
jgi:hypothetical membrane protein